jgi:hypothetical protein
MIGIQGWRNYHLSASVSGRVVQAVGSSDGFYTIDLQIQTLAVGAQSVEPLHANFIRIEVLPTARRNAPLPVCKDEEIQISGKLMWDADGFLEIHPKHSDELVIIRPACP